MSEADVDRLYTLYCDYTARLNEDASRELTCMSLTRFSMAWGAQDEAGQEAWGRRFEAGFEKTAEEGRSKLISAFSSTTNTQLHVRAA